METDNDKTKSGMKKYVLIIVPVIVIVLVLIILMTGGTTGSTFEMSSSEWNNEVNVWNAGSSDNPDFPTLSPGDTVKISGQITEINIPMPGTSTYIEIDNVLFHQAFIGNLTGTYEIGDTITVTLHIEQRTVESVTGEYIVEETYFGEGIPRGIDPSTISVN